jgi:hypothetical protein
MYSMDVYGFGQFNNANQTAHHWLGLISVWYKNYGILTQLEQVWVVLGWRTSLTKTDT